MHDLTDAQALELFAHPRISRNHVCIGTMLDYNLAWDGQVPFHLPRVESRALRDLKGAQNAIVRHRSPAQREVLRNEVRKGIETVVLAAENSRSDVVLRSGCQSPASECCGR